MFSVNGHNFQLSRQSGKFFKFSDCIHRFSLYKGLMMKTKYKRQIFHQFKHQGLLFLLTVTSFVIDSDFQAMIDRIMITDVRKKALILTNVFSGLNSRTFTILRHGLTDIIFTDMIIHAKAFSVQVNK